MPKGAPKPFRSVNYARRPRAATRWRCPATRSANHVWMKVAKVPVKRKDGNKELHIIASCQYCLCILNQVLEYVMRPDGSLKPQMSESFMVPKTIEETNEETPTPSQPAAVGA